MKKHNVNVQKRKKHYTVGAILWLIVEYVSLIFFGLCAVVPVISCVITAFKTQEEYQATNVMTLPENWLNFDNFIKAFQTADMGRAFLNSVIVMVSVLVVSIVIGTQLAYVLNRFKFPGNGLIRNLFLFASLLPAVAMQVTVYNIMTALHFVNHLYGYIILMCGTDVISIYIFIQFMENIPISLDESAIIDGASSLQRFLHVTIPNIREIILVNCMTTIIGAFQVFDEVYVMTGGGPGRSSEVLGTYLFRSGFRNDEMGYASAIATLVFVVTFIFSVVQMRISGVGRRDA